MNGRKMKLQYTFRLYLNNAAGERVLGKGGAQILEAINDYGSIVAAAKNLGMSYKFVCDYLVRIRRRLREPVVVTHRGGADPGRKRGGGGTALTPFASNLLREFESAEHLVGNALSNKNRTLTLQTLSAHRNRKRTQRNAHK